MENLFKTWISCVLPDDLDTINPGASGFVAGQIFDMESEGESMFSADSFPDARARAEMCFPYQVPPAKLSLKEQKLNIIELLFLIHGRDYHNKAAEERIAELETAIKEMELTPMEEKILQSESWWNA